MQHSVIMSLLLELTVLVNPGIDSILDSSRLDWKASRLYRPLALLSSDGGTIIDSAFLLDGSGEPKPINLMLSVLIGDGAI